MRFSLPEKKLLVLIFIISAVNPLNYVIFELTAPPGRVFAGYIDDGLQVTLMEAVKWSFMSPWYHSETTNNITVFQNPELGASYTFAAIGVIPDILSLDTMFFYIVLKFVFAFVLLIVVYNFMLLLLGKNRTKIAYVLFLLSSGIGWLIYGIFLLIFGQHYVPLVGYALTNEFEELGGGAHSLSHVTRIYWMVPEILGILSIMFFMKGGTKFRLISGVLLGAVLLAYPTFGVAFFILILTYSVVKNYSGGRNLIKMIKSVMKECTPVFLLALPFAFPWIIAIRSVPDYYEAYKLWFVGEPFIKIIVTYAFTISLSIYGFIKTGDSIIKKKSFFVPFLILLGVSSLTHLYRLSLGNSLFYEWLSLSFIGNLSKTLWNFQIFFDIGILIFSALLFYDILKKNIDGAYKFSLLWIVVITLITVVSTNIAFWWPAKMRWFLLLPLSVCAVYGLERLRFRFMNIDFDWKKILAVIILFSLPSLILFNVRYQQLGHSSGLVYLSENDYTALKFLKDKDAGRVLAWYQIGTYAPLYANKTTVLFKDGSTENHNTTKLFYVSNSSSERMNIIKRFGIKYVFFGENEMKFTEYLDEPFLTKIFDNGTKIYEVS